jgi:glutamine kinase
VTRARTQVVILGAGHGVSGALPAAVTPIDEQTRVLDWLLDAFTPVVDARIMFVGGYRADEVMARYPDLHVVFNPAWETTGPTGSLAAAPLEPVDTFVCYSDVVFRRTVVERLLAADGEIAIAGDSAWTARYDERTDRDIEAAEKLLVRDDGVIAVSTDVDRAVAWGEFAGVVKIAGSAMATVVDLVARDDLRRASLAQLLTATLEAHRSTSLIDVRGEWAELNAKQDLARFVLGTKAESLERLGPMLRGASVPRLLRFSHAQWVDDSTAVIGRVVDHFAGSDSLVVRSSAVREDSWTNSHAGAFSSILDVAIVPSSLRAAIDEVFGSYGVPGADDQVLVQAMVRDVVMSGVVMTRSHANLAPYYVVNFEESDRTDAVTAGRAARSLVLHRDGEVRRDAPHHLAAVIGVVRQIEQLVLHDSIDVEFAVSANGSVNVLQVRPIAARDRALRVDDEQVAVAVSVAAADARTRLEGSGSGGRTRLSVMSDWNPAEIIGTKPRRLASSLYRRLVTDEVWATQRHEYGYRDLRPCPLLVEVLGHPYIDVRASLTSFVPAALDEGLGERMVEAGLERLARQPTLHDKVEFDIALTCMSPDFADRSAWLREAGFRDAEVASLATALVALTERACERLQADLDRVVDVDSRIRNDLDRDARPIERAYRLLEICRRDGTPVFAHLARGAFVATSILRGLVSVGALQQSEADVFLAATPTVLSRMARDAAAVRTNPSAWAEFVREYGHLRPGTYDITSPRYADDPDGYLRPLVDMATAVEPADSAWSDVTRQRVRRALDAVGLSIEVDALRRFIAEAIVGREHAKFVFTRALSEALESIAMFGHDHGIDRAGLANISIDAILAFNDVHPDPRRELRELAAAGEAAWQLTHAVTLPPQIASALDVVCFELPDADANFVTQGAIEAKVVSAPMPGDEVEGSIVLIESADPGFDWLLARGIAALVTMYGGANSHMAVRAAELRIPAAIGVGEARFESLRHAARVRIDCAARQIVVIR